MEIYLTSLKGKEHTFDGSRLVQIIDGFAHTLAEHLLNEIQTLENLKQYHEKLESKLEKLLAAEGKNGMVRTTQLSTV